MKESVCVCVRTGREESSRGTLEQCRLEPVCSSSSLRSMPSCPSTPRPHVYMFPFSAQSNATQFNSIQSIITMRINGNQHHIALRKMKNKEKAQSELR